MAVKKRKTTDTWKKKEWYTIIAPKMFEEKEVSSTPADLPAKLIGRDIEVPLKTFTGNMQHQYVKLIFRIVDVKGKRAYTEVNSFELAREYLRRNIRRRKSMIKAIEFVKTKDGALVKTTAYAFTALRIDTTKKDAIRKILIKTLHETASKNNFSSFIQKAFLGNLSMGLLKKINQIAPIRRVEIEKCEIKKVEK